ncbi:MAG: LPS export ABC transporter periplasmic protein LptC [Dongiaceae bacterium]
MAKIGHPMPPSSVRTPAHGWIPKVAKIMLPIVAIGLVALVYFWSKVNLQFARLQISETEVAPEDIDAISMVHARFAGSDDRNRQFLVTAEIATQAIDDENTISLRSIKADVTLANGAKIVIDADAGVYQRRAKLLSLTGAVNLNHDQGYALHTTSADIDLQKKTASGHAPVTGTGPDVELAAEGFRVADDGRLVELLGRSRVVVITADEKVVR